MRTEPNLHAPMRSVLLVIPTLNEERHVQGVLRSLMYEQWPWLDLRVVVADGGSTDRTRELVSAMPGVVLLDNPKRLQSAAVNLAVRRYGRGVDVLIRCDAHAAYPPGFVLHLLEALDAHGVDAVVVPMDSVGDGAVQQATAWVSDTLVGSGGSAHRAGRRSGFVDHGHHAAFRMASFVRAGGYDESFSHNEDAELDCRQRTLGAKIWLDAGIRLAYQPRDSLKGLWRQYFSYGRGRSRTMRKHPGSWRLRQLAVPLHLMVCLLALGLAAWWPWLLVWPAVYLGVLGLTAVQLAWRHRSWRALLCAPAAWVMHTAWALGFGVGLISQRERVWTPDQTEPLHFVQPSASVARVPSAEERDLA